MIKDISKITPLSYPIKGWSHQKSETEATWNKRYWGLLWEMGCGKSKPLIDTFLRLFYSQEIDGVIIISDKGCYLNWPIDQLPKHIAPGIPHRVGIWSSSANAEEQRNLEKLLHPKDDLLDILIVNVEAFSSARAPDFVHKFILSHYTMMIVDEATSIKNSKSARTKAVKRLGQMCDYRRIATGTPIANSPMDIYSQADFLEPGLLGFTSFVAFRNHFAVMKRVILGRQQFDVIDSYRNLDQLKVMIKGFSSRYLKSECLDLPEKIYETIYVEQTPEQSRYYRQLIDESIVLMEQGILTSTSALTTIMKLHQINCGHLKIDGDVDVEIPSNRIQVLLDLLEKIPGKVLIWGHYQGDMRLIERALGEIKGDSYGVPYHGQVAQHDREQSLHDFINDPLCKWMYGTPSCGGKGINGLTVAHDVIYYSNGNKLEARLQSEDRCHRPGQKNNVTYYDLVIPKTVDEKIVKSLLNKRDLATNILDNFKELLSPH